MHPFSFVQKARFLYSINPKNIKGYILPLKIVFIERMKKNICI